MGSSFVMAATPGGIASGSFKKKDDAKDKARTITDFIKTNSMPNKGIMKKRARVESADIDDAATQKEARGITNGLVKTYPIPRKGILKKRVCTESTEDNETSHSKSITAKEGVSFKENDTASLPITENATIKKRARIGGEDDDYIPALKTANFKRARAAHDYAETLLSFSPERKEYALKSKTKANSCPSKTVKFGRACVERGHAETIPIAFFLLKKARFGSDNDENAKTTEPSSSR